MSESIEKKKLSIDVWAGIVMIAFSAVIIYVASGYPEVPKRFPIVCAVFNILIGVILLIRGILQSRKEWAEGKNPEAPMTWARFKYALMGSLGVIAYALLMPWIHFFPATLIFVPLMMLYLRERNWKVIVGVDAGLNLFLYWMFVMALKVPLP